MLRQATEGPVDAITGDYLAGMLYKHANYFELLPSLRKKKSMLY
jgi:hypothetical protein